MEHRDDETDSPATSEGAAVVLGILGVLEILGIVGA